MPPSSSRSPLLVSAVLLTAIFATALPAVGQDGGAMTQAEFESRLAEMQSQTDLALERYQAGDADEALEAARFVAGQFAFNGTGASELELKIKEVSAVAIGDRVKAYASRLVSALEAGKPVADVEAVVQELAPSLNRLVLIAQGKTTPASQRTLRTHGAIDAAVAEVEAEVDRAVSLYGQGKTAQALEAAKEAFFVFETNGLGPDTSTVDNDLEDEAENLIVNFDATTVESDPGLSQLIENGSPIEDLEAQAERIRQALGEVAELLKATLPPLNLGDANGDGRVSIVDALLTAQAALGVRATTEAMDGNQDARVTITDALLIAQAALGLRTL